MGSGGYSCMGRWIVHMYVLFICMSLASSGKAGGGDADGRHVYGKVSGRWQIDGRTVPACRTRWGVKRRALVVVVESEGVHCCGSGGSGGGDDGAEDGPDDRLRRLRTGADC